jgi:hypothetical protein
MKRASLFLLYIFYYTVINAQVTVDIAESTLKIKALGGEEFFYFGFAEGDKLIFNFQEVNGKELKEVEIVEMPTNSKFLDYKVTSIENKVLNIPRTGIYKFRFSNSALTGRICKIKIQRIPASSDTRNFNTNVYWRTVYDTSFSILQEKYLIRTDTTISNITDQVAKVHSQTNANGNKTTFNFTLPINTISWSYYVGVDQAGQKAFESASKELFSKSAPIIAKMPGYGPMAALALGSVSYLYSLQSGEDIDYFIVDGNNVNSFLSGQQFYYIKKGKVINDYSRMTNPLCGSFHFCLSNDNAISGVSVSVKITAILVTEEWGEKPVKKMVVSAIQEPYLEN